MAIFMSGGMRYKDLPSGFTRLSYIESTGTQYIDSGFSNETGFRITCTVELTSLSSQLSMLFGSHDTYSPFYRNYLAVTSGSNFEVGAYDPVSAGAASVGEKFKIDCCTIDQAIQLLINGVDRGINKGSTSPKRSSRTVYIFALNYTGGLLNAKMKLYDMQIYSDSSKKQLVRNFIPCANESGSVGLYDTVTQQFYGNSGTGSFSGG